MCTTPVGDDELLYRRVPNKPENFKIIDGVQTVGASAFNCRYRQPSVNRQELLPDPIDSKLEASDGVIGIIARDVRAISTVALAPPTTGVYQVLVEPRPIYADAATGGQENLAHAQIESNPAIENENRFRRLKEALARLANQRPWIVEPG